MARKPIAKKAIAKPENDLARRVAKYCAQGDVAKAAAREAEKDATIAALLERQAAMEAMLEELTKPKPAKASKEAEAA